MRRGEIEGDEGSVVSMLLSPTSLRSRVRRAGIEVERSRHGRPRVRSVETVSRGEIGSDERGGE